MARTADPFLSLLVVADWCRWNACPGTYLALLDWLRVRQDDGR